MTDRLLGVLAATLLLVAVAARGLVLASRRCSGEEAHVAAGEGMAARVSVMARLGAALVLAAALTWGIYDAGGSWANDLRLLAFGLVLAMLLVDLCLTWDHNASCASPLLEGLGAVFLLVMAVTSPLEKGSILCAWGSVFYHARWALYVIGVGSLVAAGSATLVAWLQGLLVRRGVTWHGTAAEDSTTYVCRATLLALLTLGAGLALGACWFWQAQGQLTGTDVREVWMAIAWLVSGSSVLAWELPPRARRWATGLVVLAGLVAVSGLLATL